MIMTDCSTECGTRQTVTWLEKKSTIQTMDVSSPLRGGCEGLVSLWPRCVGGSDTENKNNECGRTTDGARHQSSASEKNGGECHLVPVLPGS